MSPLRIADSWRPAIDAPDREVTLTEAWLRWAQRLPDLSDDRGRSLEIIYAGHEWGGAGPDIRDAIVSFDGGPAEHGDIEVHLDARDWIRHGHAENPAYEGVILHVVWEELSDGYVGPAAVVLKGRLEPEVEPVEAEQRTGEDGWPCETSASDSVRLDASSTSHSIMCDATSCRIMMTRSSERTVVGNATTYASGCPLRRKTGTETEYCLPSSNVVMCGAPCVQAELQSLTRSSSACWLDNESPVGVRFHVGTNSLPSLRTKKRIAVGLIDSMITLPTAESTSVLVWFETTACSRFRWI